MNSIIIEHGPLAIVFNYAFLKSITYGLDTTA